MSFRKLSCTEDVEVLRWQSVLAKNHNIGGFAFYHYWFKGKKLLEKPAEILLSNKSIDLPFCFCWANEPWSRSWTGGDHDILIEQNYGHERDWEAQIEYLIPFFKDPRYIRLGNKPIFIIYRTSSIENCDSMLEYMDNLVKEKYNLDGIYFVEMLNSFQSKSYSKKTEAIIEFEPMYTIKWNKTVCQKILGRVSKAINPAFSANLFSYDYLWKKINSRVPLDNKKTFPGAFVDWDNSPRKSSNATIVKNVSVAKFKKYFNRKFELARTLYSAEFIFINAWNEWAEGTYLEPDSKNEYAYLEVIKNISEDM